MKEQGVFPYAEASFSAGFVVLFHDHRGIRGKWRNTPTRTSTLGSKSMIGAGPIAYLQSRPEVDEERIGLWGSSYSGGHAIVLGATEPRLKAIVSQVPTISGYQQGLRRSNPTSLAVLEASFAAEDRAQLAGEEPHRIAMVSDGSIPASYTDPEST